jgi:hypothetical protein
LKINLEGRGIKTLIKRKKGDFLLHYSGETVSEDEGQSREEAGSSGYRFFYKFEGSAFWYELSFLFCFFKIHILLLSHLMVCIMCLLSTDKVILTHYTITL